MATTLTATCTRCGRPITDGKCYGSGCAARLAHAIATVDTTGYTPQQVEKAVELIEQGGIVRVGHLFLAVSSNGSVRYEVAATGECSCTAAAYGRRCYHVLGARFLAAS
jgi:hypothetical protein